MAGPVQQASLTIANASGGTLACLFNPKDFSVTKANTWDTKAPPPGEAQHPPVFTGGTPPDLTLDLLFDSTLLSPAISVASACNTLMDSMNATESQDSKENKSRPPTMTFRWGRFGFEGVAKSITIQYQLFNAEGEPIRASVKLALTKWDVSKPHGQNPTTRSSGALGSHIVRDGDSLPSIAYRAYGDATRWRAIAEANGIDNPLGLRSGTALSVPALDS